jgi:hypothetical protein
LRSQSTIRKKKIPAKEFIPALIGLLCLILQAAPAASAMTCNEHSSTVKEAHSQLRHASSEADFSRAKHYAWRANNALDRAAKAATECACDKAHRDFKSAALYARRAKSAKDPQQLSSALDRALHEFNSASRALHLCSRNE